jgi:hypothetical protein
MFDMSNILRCAIASAVTGIIINAYPIYQTYNSYRLQTAQFEQENAVLDAKEAIAISKFCDEYKKWQYYMLINNHSEDEYTTSMDHRCYN